MRKVTYTNWGSFQFQIWLNLNFLILSDMGQLFYCMKLPTQEVFNFKYDLILILFFQFCQTWNNDFNA